MTILRVTALLLAAASLSSGSVGPASAQTQCGPREQVVKSLGQTFQETPVGMGVTQPGQVLELFASPSGSWTMVVTAPDGTSCRVAAGENWDMVRAAKGRAI